MGVDVGIRPVHAAYRRVRVLKATTAETNCSQEKKIIQTWTKNSWTADEVVS